jgi:hypothetical protein
VFYVERDKGRENASYQVYIQNCYFYVLVNIFLCKITILFILYSCFRIESAFYHRRVITIRKQQQGSRHEIWDLQRM